MAETYFGYAVSQCRIPSIKSVCSVYSTLKELKDRAAEGFNGSSSVTADRRLFNTVSGCLKNKEIINPNRFDMDALTIYERCRERVFSGNRMGYESWFDNLIDINWLLASIQNADENNHRGVSLLIAQDKVDYYIREYLLNLYNSAVQDNNECVYLKEAMQAKRKLFSGLYDFQYEESKKYLSSDFQYSDLEQREYEYRDESICKMSMFLGLTATAVLEKNIRRYC